MPFWRQYSMSFRCWSMPSLETGEQIWTYSVPQILAVLAQTALAIDPVEVAHLELGIVGPMSTARSIISIARSKLPLWLLPISAMT